MAFQHTSDGAALCQANLVLLWSHRHSTETNVTGQPMKEGFPSCSRRSLSEYWLQENARYHKMRAGPEILSARFREKSQINKAALLVSINSLWMALDRELVYCGRGSHDFSPYT